MRKKIAQNIPIKINNVIHFVLFVFLSRTFATRDAYILAEQLIVGRCYPQIFVLERYFFAVLAT